MTKPKKKVLIITYYWPPGSSSGVQRWLRMSAHLVALGVEVTVLTVENGSYPSRDESLLADVHPDIEVHRTSTLEPFHLFNRLLGKRNNDISVGLSGYKNSQSLIKKLAIWIRANLFIPDARKGWRGPALRKGKQLLKSGSFDLIVTTGTPHSCHLIGQKLSDTFNVMWLADFRDPWSTIYYHKQMPMWNSTKAKHLALETKTLKRADFVSVVSLGMKREFEDRASRIEVIYNGFDSNDFERATQEHVAHQKSRFCLSYVGNLLPSQNVVQLWRAIGELIQTNSDFSDAFELRLIGHQDPVALEAIRTHIPSKNLSLSGFVAHQAAITEMSSADVLLLVIPDLEDNELILTGKLFEYLATSKPVLSVGPKTGDASTILIQCGHAPMLDYLEFQLMKTQLLSHFQDYAKGKTESVENEAVLSYSRQAQAKKMLSFTGLLEL